MARLILWLCIAWSLVAILLGVVVLGSGADLEGIALRQDIRQLLTQAAGDAGPAMIAWLDGQSTMLSHTALFLAVTGSVCLVAGLVGLRSGKKEAP